MYTIVFLNNTKVNKVTGVVPFRAQRLLSGTIQQLTYTEIYFFERYNLKKNS